MVFSRRSGPVLGTRRSRRVYQARPALRFAAIAVSVLCANIAFAQTPSRQGGAPQSKPSAAAAHFRVCADPENMFVYPRDKGPQVKSLDDPILKKIKIGVHLLGDDYNNPPPVHELSKRGVVGNLVGFSTFYSAENPPSAIIDAVAAGKVDIAIVWGPAAGYYVKQQRVPLVMVPVPSEKGDLPFEFGISMGVKPGNDALKAKLEKVIETRRAEITKILNDYNVPLVERKAGPKQ